MRYKVEFEGNKAVKATPLHSVTVSLKVEFGEEEYISTIRSLVIDAENEKEALECANEMVGHIWSDLLIGKN